MNINTIIFISGLLLLIGILSSKFSARIGMPVLVLFLGVGMLAGSEGIGGFAFEDYNFSNSIGSIALAVILYDGGLRTSITSVRSVLKPALSLSTIGVLLTSLITGLAASWILELTLLQGLLLGGIVGSTDAAAVFSVLRNSGLKLQERLTATLEVESGSNDPMAIFLTVGIIGILTKEINSAGSLLLLFVLQFGVGTIVGIGIGYIAYKIINRANLDYPGLYPLLVLAFGFLSFGLAAKLEGSGFLSVYISGIVLGNKPLIFRRGIFLFHDAIAWLGQIILFILLGLLSFPSRLFSVAVEGLLIAIVLIFIARPLAVLISVFPFRFSSKELIFISWVGLKGAIPITLATFPLIADLPSGELIFNVVFFIVLTSAVTQGWSLPTVADWLGLAQSVPPTPPLTIEINALKHVDAEIVDYTVPPSARVLGYPLRSLAFPDGVMVTLIVRQEKLIMPQGSTMIQPGDHVFVAMKIKVKPFIDRFFGPYTETPLDEYSKFTLSFSAHKTTEQIQYFFGLTESVTSKKSAAFLLEAEENKTIRIGPFLLTFSDDPHYVVATYSPEELLPEEETPSSENEIAPSSSSSSTETNS